MYDILAFDAIKTQEKTNIYQKVYILPYTTHHNAIKIILQKLLTPNIQRIKSIQDTNATSFE